MKMKQVYEANPALGDPMSIQGQLQENGHRLDKLRAELKKFQVIELILNFVRVHLLRIYSLYMILYLPKYCQRIAGQGD